MAESDPLGSTMEMGKIVGKLVSDSSVQTTTGRLEQKKEKQKESTDIRQSGPNNDWATGNSAKKS